MLTVHVHHPLRSGPLMQVIDVLGDDRHLPAPCRFQPRQRCVRRIWCLGLDRSPAHIVESQHEFGIAGESLGRGHVLHPVLFPQAPFCAEGIDAAFGGNAGAGEDEDVAVVGHPRHETSLERRRQVARIGIIGSDGRMGHALAQAITDAGEELAGGIGRDGDAAALAASCDILVDFSSPSALEDTLDAAAGAKVPIVIGTTGLEERHHWLIDAAAETIPVLQTGNTSLGVTLLAHLVREAAMRLGEDWDIEIAETHHRMKVDAPSGTALLLGDAAAEGRGVMLADHAVRGRDGITGARENGTIGFAALRGGSVAGDHTVHFLADNERLTFSHMAENRSIFAKGAVRAAQWLIGKDAGRYTMPEVLGL